MTAGQRLRTERLNRGLTVRDAAREMGLADWKTLQRAEADDTVPQPGNAFKMTSFYGLIVTDLWPVVSNEVAA